MNRLRKKNDFKKGMCRLKSDLYFPSYQMIEKITITAVFVIFREGDMLLKIDGKSVRSVKAQDLN